MKNDSYRLSIGGLNITKYHFLIISILILSFTISFLLRIQPAEFGWELNEFDPFFNFRSTQYILENGLFEYFDWNDELSWYPSGRDVSSNSQVMLHITTAYLYWIFGGNSSLYDFTIIFPVIIGSLTTIVIFGIGRIIGGTSVGLLSSLFFSISIPILLRGSLGWFKSEPLGLFFGLISVYLLLSGISGKNQKSSILKLLFSGLFLSLGLSAWGGTQFFFIIIGIFFLTIPFSKNFSKNLIFKVITFSSSTILISLLFERPGIDFIFGLGGLTLLIPTIFINLCYFIQKFSNNNFKKRNTILFIIFLLIFSSVFITLNNTYEIIPIPTHRYLNVIFPILTTTDPLVDSISEHATLNLQSSFILNSIFLILAGIGVWIILSEQKIKNYLNQDLIPFILISSFFGVYVSSAFMRLELFASISLIFLSSIGLTIIMKKVLSKNFSIKVAYSVGILFLIIVPFFILDNSNIFAVTNVPSTILNGGTGLKLSFDDWNDSLDWIKVNTPTESVIASWWDYGYWIQTKSERATISDNSTLIDSRIEQIAKIFFKSPDEAWTSLQKLEADYFVLYLVGQRLTVDSDSGIPLYSLGGGGDESKKYWFAKIAQVPIRDYINPDMNTGTELFWQETFLGKITPFQSLGFVNFQTQQMSPDYQPGWVEILKKDFKFTNDNEPFRLVYYSKSLDAEKGEIFSSILIYEINDNYNPQKLN